MNKPLIIGAIALVVIGTGWFFFNQGKGAPTPTVPSEPQDSKTITSPETSMKAIMKTNKGDITLEFFSQDAPKTVENFTTLAKDGFYDNTKFHRVIAGFMIQGGDPLSKDDSIQEQWGRGDPGYKFADEIHENNHNTVGTISMANSGPNTNGSQFFINVADNNPLDPKHTVFGEVIKGMDIVHAIENVATGDADRPIDPVVIESITIIEE